MLDLADHFSRFMAAEPERIHFAAHSHHYWPDVTFAAQQRCWEDAARNADEKWGLIFGEVIPAVQTGIARVLNLADPSTIAFAPNTHEFLRRLLSGLPAGRPSRILTSDGEFHSLTRQIARLEEDRLVEVERIPVEPAETFAERFGAACGRGGHDLVYVSQVFFNSGATARRPRRRSPARFGRRHSGRRRRLSRLHGAADGPRPGRGPDFLSRGRVQVRHGG